MNTVQWNRWMQAFSGTDLLGTVVGVGVLGCLMLTAGSQTSIHSEAARCLNNMRQLTQAWMMFAADHDDYLPGKVNILWLQSRTTVKTKPV